MWVLSVRTVDGFSSRSTMSGQVRVQPPTVVSGADKRPNFASLPLTSRWVRACT